MRRNAPNTRGLRMQLTADGKHITCEVESRKGSGSVEKFVFSARGTTDTTKKALFYTALRSLSASWTDNRRPVTVMPCRCGSEEQEMVRSENGRPLFPWVPWTYRVVCFECDEGPEAYTEKRAVRTWERWRRRRR